MGEKITIELEARTVRGKKVARLRKQSIVPGVVYGSIKSDKPYNVQMPLGAFEKAFKAAGKHSPVSLRLNGKPAIAMIKDVERDAVKRTPLHVSFHAVKSDEPVVAEIPIRLIGEGESEAEKNGLIVLQTLEKLEVKALPLHLPEALEVSIASLKAAGDRLTVADLKMADGVEIVDNDDGREGTDDDENSIMDLVIANVYEPSALAAANDAAGGDAEDESEVEADNGSDTPESTQDEETRPGGKLQDEPKQSNVDANK